MLIGYINYTVLGEKSNEKKKTAIRITLFVSRALSRNLKQAKGVRVRRQRSY